MLISFPSKTPAEIRWLRLTGLLVAAVGTMGVVGLVGGVRILTTFGAEGSPQVMNVALLEILCGAGFVALAGGVKWLARGCGATVAVFCGLSLGQSLLGWSFGIDEIFWRHDYVANFAPPGRMAPQVAVALFLAGWSLFVTATGWKRQWLLPVIGGVTFALGLLPLALLLTAAFSGGGVDSYHSVSLPAMSCILLLAGAMIRRSSGVEKSESWALPMMAAALGMLLSLALVLLQASAQLKEANRLVTRTYEIRGAVDYFVSEIARMESSSRGYVLTGVESFRARDGYHRAEAIGQIETLRRLVGDDPAQSARVRLLGKLAEGKAEQSSTLMQVGKAEGADAAARALMAQPTATSVALVNLADEIKVEENRLLVERTQERRRIERGVGTLEVLGALMALGLMGASLVNTVRSTRARQRAEGTLLSVNQFQRAVLDGTDFSVIATKLDGTILEFNVGAEKMLGYTRVEMVNRQTPAILHVGVEVVARAAQLTGELGRVIEPGFEAFVARARLGSADENEWTYVRKDGSELPVHLSITAMRDGKGEITGFMGIARDLTVQKNSEKERNAIAARMHKLGSQVPGLLFQFKLRPDGSSCFPYASEGIRKIYGVTPEEVREDASKVWALVHPDDLAAVKASVELSVQTLKQWVCDYRTRLADGTERWVLGNATPEREPDGAVLWHGFITDITERKQAEVALQSVRAQLERTFASMSEGLIVQDAQGVIIECNAAATRILGLTRTQAIGRAAAEVNWRCIRDDGTVFDRAEHPSMVTLRTGWPQREVIMACRRVGGSLGWIEINSELIGSLEDPGRRVVCSFRDVTARHAAEADLSATLGELARQKFALDQHSIVAITDIDGIITYVNEKFCQISQYSREELMGKNHRLINSGHHPKEFFTEMFRVIASGEVWHGEICNRAKDGSIYWEDSTIVPSSGNDGKPNRYVSIRTDMTERKRLGASLAQARDEALEASRLKSEFLANMSHEIRTPMNGIIGMAGLLMDSPLDDKQREMSHVISDSAENLLTIINDILDFSKIEAGKLRIEPAEFELRSVFEDTLAILAFRAHEKELELVCDFDEKLEIALLGDAGRLRQMLTNLAGNAIKFTESGEVLVRAKLLEAWPERVSFRVSVTDSGIGIAPAVQVKLFQPFSQADGTSTRNYGGTGLGLAITRQLVELMGGTIGLTSEEGKGSEFWFELTLPRGVGGTLVQLPPLPVGTRVLVVDDNTTNRKILVGQILAMGGRVDAVGSGQAALDQLLAAQRNEQPYDVAVLDWHMPGMDGVDLAGLIRAEPAYAALSLIMLSSAGPMVKPEEADKAKFAAHLNKPVRLSQLHGTLRRVLGCSPHAARTDTRASFPLALGRLRLLVAEDNPTNQLVIQGMLGKLGCQIDFANNGAEAVTMVALKPYDVVLMDCQMPVMDGYAATAQIRRNEAAGQRRTPIIALTAYAMPSDRAKCLNAGMDEYLSKPLREPELKRALRDCGLLGQARVDSAPIVATESWENVLETSQLELLRKLPGRKHANLLLDVIELYLGEAPQAQSKLSALAPSRDKVQVMSVAHRLAGSSANLGATEMRAAALAVEKIAEGEDWAALPVKLVELEHQWQRVKPALLKLQALPPIP